VWGEEGGKGRRRGEERKGVMRRRGKER